MSSNIKRPTIPAQVQELRRLRTEGTRAEQLAAVDSQFRRDRRSSNGLADLYTCVMTTGSTEGDELMGGAWRSILQGLGLQCWQLSYRDGTVEVLFARIE